MPRPSPPSPNDLDSRIDRLYGVPLDRFVPERNALAAELKRDGRADESAQVKGLARPSIPAWAVNQVYWHARDEFERLTAAGDQMRDLQRRALSGREVDLRDATRERQHAVRAFVDRAVSLMKEGGATVTDATRQRISTLADAIAAYGSRPQEYPPGRLEQELEPPGFEALAGLTGGSAPPLRLVKSGREGTGVRATRQGEAAKRAAAETAAEARARTAEEREAQRRQDRAQKEAAAARRARERDLERAKEHEAALSARLTELRRELAPLEMRVAALQQRAQDAEAALQKARERVRDATAALRDE
jgi:hypothetical protein